MTATAYTDAVKQFNGAYAAWNAYVAHPEGDAKSLLDALIAAAAKCIGSCPITSDRLWYEEKHEMAVQRRAKCA